jgi:hypothetical protein
LCSAAQARRPEFKAVTVAELEQMVPLLHSAGDAAAAKMLSASRLSERLSGERLELLLGQMPGRHAREQLLALVDEAEFQALPVSNEPARAIPGPAEQDAMRAHLLDYVQNTVRHWPRFTVTRTALRYEGTAEPIPGGLQDELRTPLGRLWVRSPDAANWECPGHPKEDRARLAVIEKTIAPVLVRSGVHTVHSMDVGGGEFACSNHSTTADEFGEMLILVPLAMARAEVQWSRWQGMAAVFRFRVPVENARGGMSAPLRIDLDGEIAFDPASGAIQRLTATRKWRDDSFEKEYRTMVEYAPIVFNGSTWFFPAHRVALYRTPFLRPRKEGGHVERTYRHYRLAESPMLEYLVDARFSGYVP